MKVLVAGSRDWTDKETLFSILNQFEQEHPQTSKTLLSGGCRGADFIAEQFAQEHKWKIERFLPDWQKYGKAAGPIRNNLMLEQQPEFIFCFPLFSSKGTLQLISQISKLSPSSKVYIHQECPPKFPKDSLKKETLN